MIMPNADQGACALPPIGDDPSTLRQGTSPGSFANKGRVGTPWAFSSPDTPGMPQPSNKTAWDFLPAGWTAEIVPPGCGAIDDSDPTIKIFMFQQADGTYRGVTHPIGFVPVTQLEHARLGIITPQMRRVAEREGHLMPEQVRDEVAA